VTPLFQRSASENSKLPEELSGQPYDCYRMTPDSRSHSTVVSKVLDKITHNSLILEGTGGRRKEEYL